MVGEIPVNLRTVVFLAHHHHISFSLSERKKQRMLLGEGENVETRRVGARANKRRVHKQNNCPENATSREFPLHPTWLVLSKTDM
jgi:hypothetical protein